MKYYLEAMKKRLSEDDVEQLKEIYEPTVVTIPPVDASCSMCVTADGELRIYGSKHRKEWGDFGKGCYIFSTDCGLSWKTHYYQSPKTLGAAGYNPNSGRYIAASPTPYRGDLAETHEAQGSYVFINETGFNADYERAVKLSDKTFLFLKQPEYFDRCKRWIAVAQYENEVTHVTVPVVCFSDDDGESWTVNEFENHAPVYEKTSDDQGERWQNYSCEPTITELSDGTMLMIERTSQNFHYMRFSDDHGTTWTSEPKPTRFYGTNTMPVLYKLDDGRILFFWCNTELLPELDQVNVLPPLGQYERSGVLEDVFTNRDANHLAISSDDGKTWRGFREVYLNPVRYNSDFRRTGDDAPGDKSVHQGQMLELPYNKLLIHFGQHQACTRVVILDIDWLYETSRVENFRFGLRNLTTQMYLKSVLGCIKKNYVGHCAYNRICGAAMAPDPDMNSDEALQILRVEDERLIYRKQGCVWNFPASESGKVTVRLRVVGGGVLLSLTDHWQNAFDETIRKKSNVCFEITDREAPPDRWTDVVIRYTPRKAELYVGEALLKTADLQRPAVYGLSYLHIQTLAESEDYRGTYVKLLKQES